MKRGLGVNDSGTTCRREKKSGLSRYTHSQDSEGTHQVMALCASSCAHAGPEAGRSHAFSSSEAVFAVGWARTALPRSRVGLPHAGVCAPQESSCAQGPQLNPEPG